MYDIKALEEEWKIYNNKKMLPIYIGILIAILFSSLILFAFYKGVLSREKIEHFFKKHENKNSISIPKKDKKLENKLNINTSNEVNITLSRDIIKKDNPIETIVDNIPILEDNNKLNSNTDKKITLNIIESSSLEAYLEVEKRFDESHNIDDSIFLAKSYYRKGKYKKSEYWALQTNKMNETIDDSWIIFIESKIKLGQKNEAIGILKKYIKRTNSKKAKNILLRMNNK